MDGPTSFLPAEGSLSLSSEVTVRGMVRAVIDVGVDGEAPVYGVGTASDL